MILHPLDCIPDLEKDEVGLWALECASRAKEQDFRTKMPLSVVAAPRAGMETWGRFISSALLADWACYSKTEDRADYARLRSVITAFPQGFRVYFSLSKGDVLSPVGYTGWYPIEKDVFERLYAEPGKITHRGFMAPLREMPDGGAYIYLFNYSIIPSMRGTAQSRSLVKDYAEALKAVPAKGMAAVTVSEDGARVAEKFGLSRRGDMTHDGVAERVYAVCL